MEYSKILPFLFSSLILKIFNSHSPKRQNLLDTISPSKNVEALK